MRVLKSKNLAEEINEFHSTSFECITEAELQEINQCVSEAEYLLKKNEYEKSKEAADKAIGKIEMLKEKYSLELVNAS